MPYEVLSGSDCSKSSRSEVELVYDFKLSFDTAIPENGCFGSSVESVRFGSKKLTLSVENCSSKSFRSAVELVCNFKLF